MIRCPACNWKPDGGAYWCCEKCAFVWNTFDTQARCPNCKHSHEYTQCIAFKGGCEVVSLHEDWYEGLEDCVDELKAELSNHNFEII